MKRLLLVLTGISLVALGCSDDASNGPPDEQSRATASTAQPTIYEPADQVNINGVQFRLTGHRSYVEDSGITYTVLAASATNNGPTIIDWDPFLGFTPQGQQQEDYTLLDLNSGVDGVFETGTTVDLEWGFSMEPAALKKGTLEVAASDGTFTFFGDFTTLPAVDGPTVVTTTASAPETRALEPDVETQAPTAAPPTGYTGAPTGDPTLLPGKTVAYCMDDPIYQDGTTMFTDGTTGWTQECAG